MKSFSFSSLDSFLGQVTNCPTCVGTGGNAAQDCENKIVMRDCKENCVRLVVAITIFGEGVFPDQGSMACSQSARKLKGIV